MFHVSDSSYDNFMGRYSTRLAPAFADFAGIEAGLHVLDVGAGTGALATELVRRETRVAALDPSPPFVAALRQRLPDVDVVEGPAEELPWPDASFDGALAQLVVTFMRDAPRGIAEMCRVVRPGGVVGACMWDRVGMEMLAAVNRTQRALDSTRPASEELTTYRSREELAGLFARPDLADVGVGLLEVEAGYSGFDELWDALANGAGPAGTWAASLDEEQSARARAELHGQLGAPDGPFSLRGRAWAVRATRV